MPYKDPEKARASARASYLRNRETILAKRRLSRYDPVKKHGQHLKRRYGITTEQYDKLLKDQNGLCKLCGNPSGFKNSNKRLFVDHNHKTGKVRGLLCNGCNIALGKLDLDNWLTNALDYLGYKERLFVSTNLRS